MGVAFEPDVRGWEGTLACHCWKAEASTTHSVQSETIENVVYLVKLALGKVD